jgi:hypothetical protein
LVVAVDETQWALLGREVPGDLDATTSTPRAVDGMLQPSSGDTLRRRHRSAGPRPRRIDGSGEGGGAGRWDGYMRLRSIDHRAINHLGLNDSGASWQHGPNKAAMHSGAGLRPCETRETWESAKFVPVLQGCRAQVGGGSWSSITTSSSGPGRSDRTLGWGAARTSNDTCRFPSSFGVREQPRSQQEPSRPRDSRQHWSSKETQRAYPPAKSEDGQEASSSSSIVVVNAYAYLRQQLRSEATCVRACLRRFSQREPCSRSLSG